MRRTATVFALLLAACAALAQRNYNLELLANVDEFQPGEEATDCWGYSTSEGLEFAIVGATRSTYVYSLGDPRNPVLRARIPGATSRWRDIKSFGTYVYVVADEGADGILVIDMSGAPDGGEITHSFYRPEVGSQTMATAHNLYISAEGLLVIGGGNLGVGEPHFFDLAQDPERPPFVGRARRVYAHDVYAEGGRLYSSDIFAGELTLHDYTDLGDIRVLGTATTSSAFTHNAWPKLGDEFVFTTDERTQASVDAYDVSDPSAIRRVDRFRPDETFTSGSVPHNTHVRGDYLVTSWYRDGVILTDATRPHNLIEVGQYDTYPQGGGGGFEGCWGAFPFFPSGRVIASDRQNGLFVFDADYEPGCYFEGTVQDSATGELLAGVTVDLGGRLAQRVETGADGTFATGLWQEGAYEVTFSKPGYVPRRTITQLRRGRLDFRNVRLRRIVESSFDVTARDEAGLEIVDAVVEPIYRGSEGTGNRYDIYVARWGFLPAIIRDTLLPEGADVDLEVTLERGYADDFTVDLGWVSSGTAIRGLWERGVPTETVYQDTVVQLGRDAAGDFGERAYGTDLSGPSPSDFDVDGGTAVLTSPRFELAAGEDARVSFAYYFAVRGGSTARDDTLAVDLTDGTQTIRLLNEGDNAPDWRRFRSAPIRQLLGAPDGPLTDLRLVVQTGDGARTGHIVEALFDDFRVGTAVGPPLTPDVASGCAPLTVTYTLADALPGATVDAPGATDLSFDGITLTATYLTPGTFGVSLAATDEDGAPVTYRYPDLVRVRTVPTAAFTVEVRDSFLVAFASTSANAEAVEWDFGDGDGATAETPRPFYRYPGPGTYEVTLAAVSACGTDTTRQTIDLLSGVREFREATGVRVVQNPIGDELTLAYEGTDAIAVELSDAAGRTVVSRAEIRPGLTTLDTAHLPAGTYFLRVPDRAAAAVPVIIAR